MDRDAFRELIAAGPVLCDGGTGAGLAAADDTPFDALNLDAPEGVLAVHRAFVEAGARLVEANTFGANRYKLKEHAAGLVSEINAAGVRLAREAGAEIVAGSVGPLGVRLAPYGRIRAETARAAFVEQIAGLAEAGADLLLIETQTDVDEAEQAVLAARFICSLPVVVSFTFTRDDTTPLGESAEVVARRLADLDVDGLGVNCSEGPAQVLRLIRTVRAHAGDLPLSAMPNAGGPQRVAGRILYPATPHYLAEHAIRYREAGVSLIGGCCGTGPEHIRAMGEALSRPPGRLGGVQVEAEGEVGEEDLDGARDAPAEAPGGFARSLGVGRSVVVVEMDPPRGFSAARLVAGAETLANAGAHAVSVADSPLARMRMSPWAACHLIQREASVATILHFTTRGRNVMRLQSDLLAAYALGIRNIFVCLGDPTAIGDYPQATDQADVTPSGLIALIKQRLNAGLDRAGASIGAPTSFLVGCALDLNAQNLDREARVLARKIEAGADFALSQPIYAAGSLRAFVDRFESRLGPLELPILVGLLPLVSLKHAEFLHNEVPGMHVPDEVRARIGAARNRSEHEGLAIAIELGLELRELAAGTFLMPPFGRYDIAAELIERTR